MSTEHGYQREAGNQVLDRWRRIHANGEQTVVVVIEHGEFAVALAYDYDPADFLELASELLAYSETAAHAREVARTWMVNNPKGVAPGSTDTENTSLARKLWRGLKRLDQSAASDMDTSADNETNT